MSNRTFTDSTFSALRNYLREANAWSGVSQQTVPVLRAYATMVVTIRDTLAVTESFGRRGRWAGQFESPHNLALDSRGNLFVGETLDGRRVQKFIP